MGAIHQMSAVAMRQALDAGELSSREIVEALYARSDEVDDRVRGYVFQYRKQALQRAEAADEARARGLSARHPLHGMPVTLKENIAVEGEPATYGVEHRVETVEPQDAVVVKVLREAGAVILGKSNLPQTLLSFETVNPIWGRSHNPWDMRRTPGGSSGGESALLSSGQSVLGIGTDIGGSVRLPAAFTGTAGLKPTRDRWSYKGCLGVLVGQEAVRAQCGPMARSAADVAFFFGAMDPPSHSRYDPMVPPLAVGSPEEVDLRGMRVGFYVDDGFFTPSPAQQRAVREAVEGLRARGAEIIEYRPQRTAEIMGVFYGIMTADGARLLREAVEGSTLIKPMRQLLQIARMPDRMRDALGSALALAGEMKLATLLSNFHRKPVERYWALTALRDELRMQEHRAWERLGIEAVVCPAFPCAPVFHDESHDFSSAACYTIRYNVLDLPAGVCPVTMVRPGEDSSRPQRDRPERKAQRMDEGSVGMPVGVQVVARRYHEDVALALMMSIEDDARQADDFPWMPITPR